MLNKKLFLLSILLLGCTAPVTGVRTPTVPESTTSTTTTSSSTTTTTITTSTTTTTSSTLPPVILHKTIVAVGDMVCSANSTATCAHEDTAFLASRFDPDMVLALGDLQYESGALSEFETTYDSSWGRFKDITYPAVGNHEYYSAGNGMKDYFNLDSFYYSIDIDNWHIIALDSEYMSTEQDEWLANDLASTDAECIIAYWHSPRWSSGVHGSQKAIQRLWGPISEAGGDIVLSGHDHHYERFNPIDGMIQFVVGTGGKSLRNVGRLEDGSAEMFDSDFGVLVLDLMEDWYQWTFVTVDRIVLDSGWGVC